MIMNILMLGVIIGNVIIFLALLTKQELNKKRLIVQLQENFEIQKHNMEQEFSEIKIELEEEIERLDVSNTYLAEKNNDYSQTIYNGSAENSRLKKEIEDLEKSKKNLKKILAPDNLSNEALIDELRTREEVVYVDTRQLVDKELEELAKSSKIAIIRR